ncbi:MAG: response regulator [Micavibrio sp.]|nr:MAG: response regulator [Micavibrio sp.]
MSEFPERVVCIDDDIDLRQLVRVSLEEAEEDIVLVTCGSGEEFIARIRELQPDLILLDMLMPDMSGPDLMEKLRDMPDATGVPFIFLTGKAKLVMTDHYKALGAIGVIHKPFDPVELPNVIREMWATRLGAE